MKKKLVSILFALILIFALKNTCDAASASISCDSTATVGEKMTINVTGSAVQWNLELKVNGEIIAKNSEVDNVDGNKNISFSGEYTPTKDGSVEVTLTGTVTEASDGSTIRNFAPKTVTVKAKETTPTNPGTGESSGSSGDSVSTSTSKSTDARLKNLGITPNDFKGFKKDIYEYSVEIPSNVSEVTVYAEPVKGAKVTSGTGKVSLKEGESKTVKISVTAEDGKATKTYTLTIRRKTAEEEENSSEARLSNLGIKPDEYDFSGFKRDTLSYSVEVPNELTEVEVYAETVSSKAKVTGTGKVSLQEGKNTVNVEVTAEDGTKKTYTLEITRKEATATEEPTEEETVKEKLGLSTLTIEGQEISPSFKTSIYEYTLGLKEDLTSLEIKAISNDKDATVEIIGNEDLQQGENIITILVTNSKTEETATYQIIVNKNVVEAVAKTSWLKPSTWGKEEKMISIIVIVLVLLIIVAIIMKIKLAKEDDFDEDIDLPGGEELDKALAEHQELAEEDETNYIEAIANKRQSDQTMTAKDDVENVEETPEVEEKSDIEKAQEYFEEYSKRRGKHF